MKYENQRKITQFPQCLPFLSAAEANSEQRVNKRRILKSTEGQMENATKPHNETNAFGISKAERIGSITTPIKNRRAKAKPNVLKHGTKRKKRPGRFRAAYTNRKAVKLLSESGHNELSTDSLSFLTDDEKLLLSSWGLPSPVLAKYSRKGVTRLFQWQLDCLDNERVLKGRNILYSAPTSAGKTLVAEILMLKRVLELGKKSIFILPFVSVAREKMYSLQELFGDVGIRVEGFMGSYNPPGGFQQVDIAVCTIEKANSLVNRLLEEGGLSQLGTVVVDELHLIGDPHRGYLLELLLTKIRFVSSQKSRQNLSLWSCSENHGDNDSSLDVTNKNKSRNSIIQIIGMSATLPNLNTVAEWLEAELVTSDFRPVPLLERIKIGDSLYDATLSRVGPVLQDNLISLSNDPDHIISLCLETILDGHSVLIFCPSKQMCESLSVTIAREFFNIGNPNITSGINAMLGAKLRQQLLAARISEVMAQLSQCPAGLDDVLRKAASFGVAFHHAGLTFDERDIIESAFKRGILKVMVATSTLSAGVNLPARRVLIVTPTFDSLEVLSYRQMSGRAGRKGIDTEGESILISNSQTQKRAIALIQAKLPSVTSALTDRNGGVTQSMKRAILEVIASGVVRSPSEVNDYAKCTLLSHIIEMDFIESVNSDTKNEAILKCLDFLEKNDFIRLQAYESKDKSPEYMATQLGSACLASSLSPDEGIIVFKELDKARRCFVLQNELHLVYQVTPIYIADQWRSLDWNQFLVIWNNLSVDQKEVGRLIGVYESFIVKAMMGLVSWKNPSQLSALNTHQRFYTALALNDLVNETSISQVAEKYLVNKGVVQNLQQAASTFAGMVTAFCNRLGWFNIELLLSQFQERLQFGVQRELVDLVRLDLLNGQRARVLHNAGIKTIHELAATEPARVAQIFHKASPFSSNVHGGYSPRSIWMLGKNEGLTETEAAKLIVKEARDFIQINLGLASVQFPETDRADSDKENANIKEAIMDESYIDDCLLQELKETEVMDISRDSPAMKKLKSQPPHERSLPEDSDCVLAGLTSTPTSHTDSPGPDTTVTTLASALKHSTPNEFHQSPQAGSPQVVQPTEHVRVGPFKALPLGVKLDSDEQNNSGFSYNNFPHSDFEKSVLNSNVLSDVEAFEMDSMTASFMDVSFADAPVEVNPLLSESLKEAAAAVAADDQETESPEFLLKSPENESPRLRRLSVAKGFRKVELSPPLLSSSSEDEDENEFTPPTTRLSLTKECAYFQNTQSLKVFGSEFYIRNVTTVDRVPASAFRSDEAIGFGVNITQPYNHSVSTGIGSRILGLGRSRSAHQTKPFHHSIVFCNGSTKTIWLYQWKGREASGLGVLMKKINSISASMAVIEAKKKINILLRNSNLKFHELPSGQIWDPEIAHWLLRSDNDNGNSLDDMIQMWLTQEELKTFLEFKHSRRYNSGTWLTTEVEEALISWKLMQILQVKLSDAYLWDHFLRIEMPSLRPVLLMERNGFKVSQPELQRLKDVLEFHVAVLELSAYRIAGRQLNLSSSKDITEILCHVLDLGEEITGRGTGKDVLSKVNHEFVRVILDWRKCTGALSKVVVPFMSENVDGRVHGWYSQLTVNGRVVMAEPSLQCVPRDFSLSLFYTESEIEKIRNYSRTRFGSVKVKILLERSESLAKSVEQERKISLRNAFVASGGFSLLSADYSQLELRILAHLSHEEKLIAVLNTPEGDVFREIASHWKGIPESAVTDEMRQDAKGITYGLIYGMGAKALSDQLGVEEKEASEFIREFMRIYPEIQRFVDQTITSCKQVGFVETISGRRRYLEHINSKYPSERAQAERQAVNSRIQGSASDLVKTAMNSIQEKLCRLNTGHVDWSMDDPLSGITTFPVLNLHDELIYEVRESCLPHVAKEIKKEMESCFKLNVKTPVVMKAGPTWGQLRRFYL